MLGTLGRLFIFGGLNTLINLPRKKKVKVRAVKNTGQDLTIELLVLDPETKHWCDNHVVINKPDGEFILDETSAWLFDGGSTAGILAKIFLLIAPMRLSIAAVNLLINWLFARQEEKTGMTIMLMDKKMDEGPILVQRELECSISNIQYSILEDELAKLGSEMLVEVIPKWIAGEIEPKPQDHDKATYTKIITKKDGEIKKDDSPEIIDKKVRALNPWPGTYIFVGNKRIIITETKLYKNSLEIKRVKPEGKKEMLYEDYLKGNPPII